MFSSFGSSGWGSIISAAGNLLGNVLSNNANQSAASNASSTELQAATLADQTQLAMFQKEQDDLAPYQAMGVSAGDALTHLLGLAPPANSGTGDNGNGPNSKGAGPSPGGGGPPAGGVGSPLGGLGGGPGNGLGSGGFSGAGGGMEAGGPDTSGPNYSSPNFSSGPGLYASDIAKGYAMGGLGGAALGAVSAAKGNAALDKISPTAGLTTAQLKQTLAQPIINPSTGMPYGTPYGETPQGAVAIYHEQMQADRNASIAQEQVLSGTAFGKMVAKAKGGSVKGRPVIVGEHGEEILHDKYGAHVVGKNGPQIIYPTVPGFVQPNPKTAAANKEAAKNFVKAARMSPIHRFMGGRIVGLGSTRGQAGANPALDPNFTGHAGLGALRASGAVPSSPVPSPVSSPSPSPTPPRAMGSPPITPSITPSNPTLPSAPKVSPISPSYGLNVQPPADSQPSQSPSIPRHGSPTEIIINPAFTPTPPSPGLHIASPAYKSPYRGDTFSPEVPPPVSPTPTPPGTHVATPIATPVVTPPVSPSIPRYVPPSNPATPPAPAQNPVSPDQTLQGLGTGFNQSTADSTASQVLQQSPQYQFAMQQGIAGLDSSAAASGGLLSGGHLAAILNYSQGLASQQYNNVYNQLLGVTSMGEAAAAGAATNAAVTGSGVSSNQMTLGSEQATNAYASGNSSSNMWNSIMAGLGSSYSQWGGG